MKGAAVPVSGQMADAGDDGRVDDAGAAAPEDLVPAWLAAVVLLLLLAVAVVAGFLIRGLIVAEGPTAQSEISVEEFSEQVQQDPNDTDALLGLAYAKQQDGDLEGALQGYERVLEIDPTDQGALYNKGTALLALDRGAEAEAVLWDVLEAAPDHVLAATTLGEYYIGQKHYKSALTALEPVAKARPEFADLQYLSGYSCEQLGIRDTAIAYYQGTLEYVPDHPEAREGLARLGVAQ